MKLDLEQDRKCVILNRVSIQHLDLDSVRSELELDRSEFNLKSELELERLNPILSSNLDLI